MPHQYYPLLKTKAGEIEGLRRQSTNARQRMRPVFHLTPSIATSFSTSLSTAMPGQSIGLDGLFNYQATASFADFDTMYVQLTQAGMIVFPTLSVGANPAYVASVLGLQAQRMILKISVRYLTQAAQWISAHGLNTSTCDLIIEAGHLADVDVNLYAATIISYLRRITPSNWGSIALSGSAAPKDYSALSLGSNSVQRKDWILWSQVFQNIPYQLHYSDYATQHPDLTEPPGVAMVNASVSARYTRDDDWLIIKGRSANGANGIDMKTQYRSHAQAINRAPGFAGVPACSADIDIASYANGQGSFGSRQAWSRIGIERHLALVADRLP